MLSIFTILLLCQNFISDLEFVPTFEEEEAAVVRIPIDEPHDFLEYHPYAVSAVGGDH